MGVKIIVNDIITNIDGTLKITTFDQTIENIDYKICDFRKWGMKWFFYEQNNSICRIYALKDSTTEPLNLIHGSEMMICEISNEIGIELPENPIEARTALLKIIETSKDKILDIYNKLQSMLNNDQIDAAWNFILTLQSLFIKEKKKAELEIFVSKLKNKINNNNISGAYSLINKENYSSTENNLFIKINPLMKYVELAVFFYTVGKHGHSINWSY